MDTFAYLQLAGWVAVGFVMFLFAATGGFDLGAGMLTPFMGRSDVERRVIINTVGPTWDGNQVWLITAGGVLFAVWPRVYAASFSGYYFAFLLVLWSLFLRPVAFEYRSKFQSQKGRNFWDWMLCIGSFVPALVIGVGIGNLFVGVPFQFDPVSLRFFYGHEGLQAANAGSDFFALLNPFSLLVGVVSVVMMLMHGAAYLAMRTDGVILKRSRTMVKVAATLLIITFAVAGIWLAKSIVGYHWHPMANPILHPLNNTVTASVGGWLTNYGEHPWMLIAPIFGFVGALLAIFFTRAQKSGAAFSASVMSVFGVVTTMGCSLFPFIMPSSTQPGQSLLVWNATSSAGSLIGILTTAVIMIPVIFIYTGFVYRKIWGRNRRISEVEVSQQQHVMY